MNPERWIFSVEPNLDGFRMVNIQPENALRERRVILGLTQQAVADRAKIPLQSYQQFESGKRKIRRASFEIACRVIEALEMTPTDFYHSEYLIGEEIYGSEEGLRYKKTGKLTHEDVE